MINSLIIGPFTNVFAQESVQLDDTTGVIVEDTGQLTFSHTVADHPNRLLTVFVGSTANSSVSSITYSGQSLTKRSEVASGSLSSNRRVSLWYLIAPPVGSANVVINMTGANMSPRAVARSLYHVNQSTPLGTPATFTSSGSSTSSIAVASAVGDLVIDGFGARNWDSAVAGANQTMDANSTGVKTSDGTSTTTTGGGSWELGASGTTTMSWSGGDVDDVAHIGVAVKQAPNVTPDDPSSLGPTSLVDGSYTTDTTPTLEFTLSDGNVLDEVKYQVQIDDSSDFSSPVVDYTSDFVSQGANSFTVGQAEGTGTYTTGNAGQILNDGSYYWQVKAIDDDAAESSFTVANAGSVAFIVDTTSPSAVSDLTSSSHTVSTWSNDTTIDVSWTPATDGGSGVVGYSYLFDTTSTTDPDTTQDGTGTSVASSAQTTSNSIYFHIRAVDEVGNWGASVHLGPFFIDITNPTTPGTPATTSPTSDTTPTWSWVASTDSNSGLNNPAYTLEWSQNSGFSSGVSSATINSTSYTHATNLSVGTWYFRVKAEDILGNISSYSGNGVVVVEAVVEETNNDLDPVTTTIDSPTVVDKEDRVATESAGVKEENEVKKNETFIPKQNGIKGLSEQSETPFWQEVLGESSVTLGFIFLVGTVLIIILARKSWKRG